jgi:magnesium-transporting ATPase (P-type)
MAPAQEESPWVATVEEVIHIQRTSLSQGLSSEEVARRREQYGTNELQKEPGDCALDEVDHAVHCSF